MIEYTTKKFHWDEDHLEQSIDKWMNQFRGIGGKVVGYVSAGGYIVITMSLWDPQKSEPEIELDLGA